MGGICNIFMEKYEMHIKFQGRRPCVWPWLWWEDSPTQSQPIAVPKSTYFIQNSRIRAGDIMSEFQLLEVVPAIERCNGRGFVAPLVQFQVPFWQTLICCHVLAVKFSCNGTMKTLSFVTSIHNRKFSFCGCNMTGLLCTLASSGVCCTREMKDIYDSFMNDERKRKIALVRCYTPQIL